MKVPKKKNNPPKIKFLSLDEVRKMAWERKKPPVVNKQLEKHVISVIKNLIRKDARNEAARILLASDKEAIGEFLYYHHSGIGNVACMVIDKAKDDLVKAKKMKQKKGDSFGKALMA